jgi:hypothetical protein
MAKKVKITSKTNQALRLKFPELRINRLFKGEGQSFLFDADAVEEMFYYPAAEDAFRKGLFYIEDKELRVKLGLEEEDGEISEDVIAPISDTLILTYLKVKPFAEFEAFFEKLPMEHKLRFADIAVKNKIVDYEKCKLIKEATNKDIMKIIQLNEEE